MIRCTTGLTSADIDEYLPQQTMDWCKQALMSQGINMDTLKLSDIGPDGKPLHVHAYYTLRTLLYNHIRTGSQPHLAESRIPYGGYEAAVARGGALHDLFFANAEYRTWLQNSGQTFLPQGHDEVPWFGHVGDDGGDRGWSERPV
jgi:hypothetical protein